LSPAEQLILNIDDDANGRDLLSRYLRKEGFQVIEAASGAAGIQLALDRSPQLILLDIRLPDMDGFQVCRQLRANPTTSTTPILQLSASYRDDASRVQSLEVGADAYLTKPVERKSFLTTVTSLLRLHLAEEQVRNTAAEWTTTFNALQDGVALLDRDGKTIRTNQRYSALFGEQILDYKPMLAALKETNQRQTVEQTNGDVILLIHLDPVLNSEGFLKGAVCSVSDITERKRFSERLQHSQKLESIGVLAGGIAHDFNNLLTGILGNASLLLDELPSQSANFEMAQEIVKASESAADLTRQLLAYAGKGRFVMQMVNLSDQIVSSRALLTRLISRNVELEFQLSPDLPALEADATQLQQIVMNLVINAAESYGERVQGRVTVTTCVEQIDAGNPEIEPGRYVMLSVQDFGSGMSPEVRARIFDPFFTTKFTGRGLGLSAVHGIMRAHHGHLRLDSAPGEGTMFRLYFPIVTLATPDAQDVHDTPLVSGEGSILVIDDEATVRNFAEAALTKMGYSVITAENGEAGLQIIQQEGGNLKAVLLDLAMPVMDGEEALQQIRQLTPSLPVLISTGFSLSSEYERLSQKGATAFLSKPFTVGQLSTALQKLQSV
jgi:DNA-binding response OmpR family regulator/two-component sensor histidine kinase